MIRMNEMRVTPPDGQYYKVIFGGTAEEIQSKINDQANNGYKVEEFCTGHYSDNQGRIQFQYSVLMRYNP